MGIEVIGIYSHAELPGHVGKSPIPHGATNNGNQHQKERNE